MIKIEQLYKSLVKQHERRLKSGKIVTVNEYSDKRHPGALFSYRGHNAPRVTDVVLTGEEEQAFLDSMKLDSEAARYMLKNEGKAFSPRQIIEKVNAARDTLMSVRQTRDSHVDDNGNYTPTRAQLHRKIVKDILSSVPSQNRPRMLMTGGLPGSGKSTMLKHPMYEDHRRGFALVDSDDIKARLAEADGLKNLGPLAGAYHAEADDVIAQVMNQGIAGKKNIIYDCTMKTKRKIHDVVHAFANLGYGVEIAYAQLPLEKSIVRAIGRFLEGGRFVDPLYIASCDHENLRTLESLKSDPRVAKMTQWDMDIPKGTKPKLVYERGAI